jgi:hypothetical protein
MTTLDLASLVLPDMPSEWRDVDIETVLAANEKDEHGLLTPRAMATRRRITEGRWYLIRNVFKWKSRNGRIESYFTTAGIERPYCGVYGIYAGYQDIVQDSELTQTITMQAHQMGAHEPISVEKAQQLYDRIRYKLGLTRSRRETERRLGPRPGGWTREEVMP